MNAPLSKLIPDMAELIRVLCNIRAPDEAYRIWCPNCGFVLGEGFIGAGRFMCRTCRWEGVVHRNEVSLVQSFCTLRSGRETIHIAQRIQRGITSGKPYVE